jgi:hypothetical protein
MSTATLRLTLVPGAWILVTALLVCCLIFLQLSFARLRKSHHAVWKDLGEPHVLSANGAFYPARKFLWSKECHTLGDALLTRRVRLARCSGMAAAVLGLALFGAMLVGAILEAL